jgi:hypothetical protein
MQFKKKEYEMVKSWNEITVEMFQRFPDDVEEINLDYIISLLAALSDKTVVEVEETTTIEQLNIYLNNIGWIKELPSDKPLLNVKINGKKYSMPKDFSRELKFGEWIDLESFINGGFRENLHNILAIIYRPKKSILDRLSPVGNSQKGIRKKKDDIDEFYIRSEAMKQMTMDQAYPIILFFYHFVNQFMKNILDYSQKEMQEMMLEQIQQINQK